MSPREGRPRKRFGQHFLIRPDIADRIVALAGLHGDETVLEVGPGRGALTEALQRDAGRLVLIEIDRDLVATLRNNFADNDNVRVIEGDVLRMDLADELADEAPVTVVSNLPYNISTPLISRFVRHPRLYRRLVLMLQKEVAERICAQPGGKEYGALTVSVQLAASARVAFRVPPSAFRPQPKVDSAIIVIEPFTEPLLSDDERSAVRHVTRTLFTQRRKQLGNLLRQLSSQPQAVLQSLEIDAKSRPEVLSPNDFVRLTREIGRHEPEPSSGRSDA